MQRTVITARPSQRVADALAQPGAEGLRQLLVVEGNGRQRRTVGLLRRSDVVAAYLRARDRGSADHSARPDDRGAAARRR